MTKRFIAGAVCPRCGAQDSIRAERDETRQLIVRDCVECGFIDELTDQSEQQELPTRVTPKPTKPEPEVQAIKFFPNPGLSRKDH